LQYQLYPAFERELGITTVSAQWNTHIQLTVHPRLGSSSSNVVMSS
jgi:hypothetical protein